MKSNNEPEAVTTVGQEQKLDSEKAIAKYPRKLIESLTVRSGEDHQTRARGTFLLVPPGM